MQAAAKLGIIAGGGALPRLLSEACAATGRPCFALGLVGFAESGGTDNQALDNPAPDNQRDGQANGQSKGWVHGWVHLGEFGKAFATLRQAGVQQVVLAGNLRRPSLTELLTELKPDLKGAAFLARVAARKVTSLGDDSLLRLVIAEIEREGFQVVGAHDILAELLAPVGVLGAHQPDAAATADIARGLVVARALGEADVGQAAIVQQGIVLGVEGAEGTDALIARCAALARPGPGGVLVKVKKPQQERRADLPTIGVATVAAAARAGLRGIAVEAGNSLIIDRQACVKAADAAGLFVIGMPAAADSADVP